MGSKDNEGGSNHGGPQAEPSENRLAANRRNATKSTGPRSADGKLRSSRNAVKHGIYARTQIPISEGPLAEDPTEIADFLRQAIDDLEPRDALEMARANQIARLQLQERRLDGLEAFRSNDLSSAARPEAQDERKQQIVECISIWNIRRGELLEAGERLGTDDISTPDDVLPWESMVKFVCQEIRREVAVRGRWDEQVTPSSGEEWRVTFEVVMRRLFPTVSGLATFHLSVETRLIDRELVRERRAVMQSMDEMDTWNQRRSRISNELARQFGMFEALQSREWEVEH